MRKQANHPAAQLAEKVIMFRVDTSKRFQKQPDGSWLVPVICEGISGSCHPISVRLRTDKTPAQDNFWSEANIVCRELRSRGYSLIHSGESTALHRCVEGTVLELQ